MNLVEQHIIKKKHRLYDELDSLSFLSKNLYNAANYIIRQGFINNKQYLNYTKVFHLIKKTVDYKQLPAKVSNQTLRSLDGNWVSFFRAIKDWGKHPEKYNSKPGLPKYKKKSSGRNIIIYEKQAVGKRHLLKYNEIKLSKSNISIRTKISYTELRQVRVIPRYDHYIVEVVHVKKEVDNDLNENNFLGVDMGMNNLCAASTLDGDFFLTNGRPLKAINHYYNKKLSRLKSELEKSNSKRKSLRTRKLTNKRNRKIKHYLHKVSKFIINFCLTNNIGKIIVGKNDNWKSEISLGKKTNQNFVQIPHSLLVNQIKYKAKLQGVSVILQEESYTSKCSFIDNEQVGRHERYAGKRIKRGLFKSKEGILINSDINGSLNIIKKVVSNFTIRENEIKGFAVSPRLVAL